PAPLKRPPAPRAAARRPCALPLPKTSYAALTPRIMSARSTTPPGVQLPNRKFCRRLIPFAGESLSPYVVGLSLPYKEHALAFRLKRLLAAAPYGCAVSPRHTACRHRLP